MTKLVPISQAAKFSPPTELEPQVFEGPWSKELVQAIAMDIGKDTVAYIEVMYPNAIKAASSTFKLSIRNHIYNQIMAAIEVTDEGQIKARLRDRKRFRRWWVEAYRKIRAKQALTSAYSKSEPNGEKHG